MALKKVGRASVQAITVQAHRLSRWASQLGITVDSSWSFERLAEEVHEALRVRYRDHLTIRCGRCGFVAPDTLEVPGCPSCGVAFGAAGDSPEGEDMAKQAATAQQVKEGETGTVVDIKSRKVRKTKDTAQKTEVQAKEAELQPEGFERRAKEAEKAAKKSLKDLEGKIDKLRDQAIRTEHDIGTHLNEIYKLELWQVAGAKDFGSYAQERFGFTRQTAKSFMRIAEMFGRDEVADIPISSLRLIVTVPDPEDRDALVQKVREEKPTARELAEVVKTHRAEAGLKTERAGFEGTVALSGRLKPGIIGTGEWKEVRGRDVAEFELGGQKFALESYDDGTWKLRLRKPLVT